MTLAIRVKREQVILPACRDGANFGVPQLLLAIDVETGRRLIWLPGHKCWFSIGRRKYYPGELIVDGVGDRTFPGTRLELPRTPIARLFRSEAACEFVRRSFMDEGAVLDALDGRRTIEIRRSRP